jgi:hypothetical protein
MLNVENRGTWVPLASADCEHDRRMGYNLQVGVALHFDDNSACRRTGLGLGVDEELLGMDALADKVQGLLSDAFTRIEATLFASD